MFISICECCVWISDELYCVWICDDVVYVFECGSKFLDVQLVNPISINFLYSMLIYKGWELGPSKLA
jgi:hypothetical protein